MGWRPGDRGPRSATSAFLMRRRDDEDRDVDDDHIEYVAAESPPPAGELGRPRRRHDLGSGGDGRGRRPEVLRPARAVPPALGRLPGRIGVPPRWRQRRRGRGRGRGPGQGASSQGRTRWGDVPRPGSGVAVDTKGLCRSICSCSRRSSASYASGVKPGTVHDTLRRKCTTAPTSKNSTRSAHSCSVDDLETDRLRPATGACRAATLVDRLGPHHEVGELTVGSRTDLLRQVRPARSQHAGDLPPEHDDGMTAHDQVERSVPEGQRGRVGDGHDAGAQRQQRPAGRLDVGPPTLGGHQERRAALATVATVASTSPPPVSMSSAAVARAKRSPIRRA